MRKSKYPYQVTAMNMLLKDELHSYWFLTQDLFDLLSVLVDQKGYKFIPIGLFGILEQEDTIERSLIRNNDIIIPRNNSNLDGVVNQIDAAQSMIL